MRRRFDAAACAIIEAREAYTSASRRYCRADDFTKRPMPQIDSVRLWEYNQAGLALDAARRRYRALADATRDD